MEHIESLVRERLHALEHQEPDAAALFTFEVQGALDALVATGLITSARARAARRTWDTSLVEAGLVTRESIEVQRSGRAQARRRPGEAGR